MENIYLIFNNEEFKIEGHSPLLNILFKNKNDAFIFPKLTLDDIDSNAYYFLEDRLGHKSYCFFKFKYCNKYTLEKIGNIYGCSKQYISQFLNQKEDSVKNRFVKTLNRMPVVRLNLKHREYYSYITNVLKNDLQNINNYDNTILLSKMLNRLNALVNDNVIKLENISSNKIKNKKIKKYNNVFEILLDKGITHHLFISSLSFDYLFHLGLSDKLIQNLIENGIFNMYDITIKNTDIYKMLYKKDEKLAKEFLTKTIDYTKFSIITEIDKDMLNYIVINNIKSFKELIDANKFVNNKNLKEKIAKLHEQYKKLLNVDINDYSFRIKDSDFEE